MHIWLRCIKKAQGVGEFNFLARVEIQQSAKAVERGFAVIFRFDEALLFILQFDVGAQRVDSGAHALFLQVGCLIVERLRKVNARFGGFNVRHSAQGADILRNDKKNYLFAGRKAVGLAGIHTAASCLVALPEREIKYGRAERWPGGKNLVRADVTWEGKSRRKLAAKLGLDVLAGCGIRDLKIRLRQKIGTCDVLVLNAFGSIEHGYLLLRILLLGHGDS